MVRGQAHADKASHRETGKMARCGIQGGDERSSIVRQRVHVITLSGILRLPLSAVVIGNHAILLFKCRPLRLEHGVVHEQAMRENDGLGAAAGFLVEEIDAVNVDGGHFFAIPTLILSKGREPYCNEYYSEK